MKLSLSTDYGSPAHWERAVDFASRHGVSRMVFWWDGNNEYSIYLGPYLFPKRPELVPEAVRPHVERLRNRLRHAAELTRRAGMEFWYCYQVLSVPDPGHAREVCPELFNEAGEPDMAGDLIYELLRDQIDEVCRLAPELVGLELWAMECAPIVISDLRHQAVPLEEVCSRILNTVHTCAVAKGLRLTQDLHTCGGDTRTLHAFRLAASRRRDVIVSGDNVIGDYHLHLPFNAHIAKAAESNPVQVNFDLNGEYWGRNFVPTGALQQYAAHVEKARELNAVYVSGRISTAHDTWSPHGNVLPSRRHFYPGLGGVTGATPLRDLEVACTDTLGAFNAEFFCRRALDPSVRPEDVVEEFLRREFGEKPAPLVPVFMELQNTLAKIFYTDRNYQAFQSVPASPGFVNFHAFAEHLTCPAGTPFPNAEAQANPGANGWKAAFSGWPVPLEHVCSGARAMIREKQEAVNEAEAMLEQVTEVAEQLRPEDGAFLSGQFEDLVFFARAFRVLCEAQIHHYHLATGKSQDGIPDRARLRELLRQNRANMEEWQTRYPGGRYTVGERLREWDEYLSRGPAPAA